jgi:hypothetical protein
MRRESEMVVVNDNDLRPKLRKKRVEEWTCNEEKRVQESEECVEG